MATTNFWICPACGFTNKPHPFRKDNTKCEQCGADQKDPAAVDYSPAGAS